MVSQRSRRYPETFLEAVTSLWLSRSPYRATATPFMPETINFWHFKSCTPLDFSMCFLKFEFLVRDVVIQIRSSWCVLSFPIAQWRVWGVHLSPEVHFPRTLLIFKEYKAFYIKNIYIYIYILYYWEYLHLTNIGIIYINHIHREHINLMSSWYQVPGTWY